MSFVYVLFLFLFGALLTIHLGERSILKIVGLAFPFAFGFNTISAFISDILGVPITIYTGFFTLFSCICILTILNLTILKEKINSFSFRKGLKSLSSVIQRNWGVLGLIFLLGYIIVGVSLKSLLWPTAAYDSIAGYDFVAQVISVEHAINNDIFNANHNLASLRSSYPPLVPINFAFAYMAGFEYPKIVSVLIVISISILMCSLSFDCTKNWFFALLATVFLMITPEFLSMSALSLTNVPTALYAGFGLIFIYKFIITSDLVNFNIGALLLGIGMWARTEVIIFGISAIILTAWWSYANKKNKPTIKLTVLVFGSYLIWKFYIENILQVQIQQGISFMPFYDAQKIQDLWTLVMGVTFNTQYYGWIVYSFLLFSLSLIFPFNRKDNLVLFFVIMTTWILFILLYYQMDNLNDGRLSPKYITGGYRRGLFSFLPLIVYFIIQSSIVQKICSNLNDYSKSNC